MFTNVSMTGVGIATYVVMLLLQHFGVVNPDSNMISQVISDAVYIVSSVFTICGQLRRPDLKMGLIRR